MDAFDGATDDRRSGPEFEREQERRNPNRERERDRAVRDASDRLRTRGVRLTGQESSDDVATLLSAVEEFELAVERKGGDIMVHSPDSSQPERRDFMLPHRRDDEPVLEFIARLQRAAGRVERRFH